MIRIGKKPPVLGVLVATFALALIPAANLPTAQASHLKHASDATLEKVLEARLEGLPRRHRQIVIAPSPAPRKLPRAIEDIPEEAHRELAWGSALSFLYWDGKALKHDMAREDIVNELPVYGLSMSKSITSYLLGRALCEGLVRSLDDPIKKYVSALNGTFYGDATIRNALNMTSGDRKLYSDSSNRGGPRVWQDYVAPVAQKGVPVVDAMRALGNREPSGHTFAYRDANADAVAMVIGTVAPEGLGKFASRTLAKDAGFEHPALYLADRNDVALAFAFFYATRLDWLRAGILIGEAFKSKGCIGDYLRSSVSQSVPVNLHLSPYRRYGKFFWTDSRWANREHVAMLGHGGQMILVDLNDGRVMYVLAIRRDFDREKIVHAVFE